MKSRFLLLFLLLICGLALSAQNISVKSFQALPMDMTASSLEGKRIDQNGEVAALIKVVTSQQGFTFEGGTLGIVDTKQENGEIWVWVPRASRKITIKHQQLGELNDYRFPIEIAAERTYEMVLSTGKVETVIKEEMRMQHINFQIVPHDALLWVNDEIWEVNSDGNASNFLGFGTYTYRVQAPNYHPDAGKVVLDNSKEAKTIIVNLKPNFGWIEVAGDGPLKDASVYIDDVKVGKAPCKSDALKSGTHTVRIIKKMYTTYTQTVTVNDNETIRLAPTLTGDFVEMTLKVGLDAEIWVNNEKKGVGSWTGPLSKGSCKIECRKAGYEPNVTIKEITANMEGETLVLMPPKPIYGSLDVESKPKSATLFIDGKNMGSTPQSINELIIGEHELRLTLDGYADYYETVTIAKEESHQVSATLSKGQKIQFTCNVSDAELEIDGRKVGCATGAYMLAYGLHKVKATASDRRDYTATIDVSKQSYNHNIMMNALDEECFTVNGVSFKMKLVEGGTFQMGATPEQMNEASWWEQPVHTVTVNTFMIGETEVTQELWKAVMGRNPSGYKHDDYPVESVSWNDCQKFISKLNEKTGKNFRMPTEAEWEYAARVGKKSKGYKYSGSDHPDDVASYKANDYYELLPAKSKLPNELGLYQMSGNVSEWCSDWYDPEYYKNSPSSNPKGPASGWQGQRAIRGGSLIGTAGNCRVSYRFSHEPDRKSPAIGLRLVLPQ